jgi:outer membrane cobalamin receptor
MHRLAPLSVFVLGVCLLAGPTALALAETPSADNAPSKAEGRAASGRLSEVLVTATSHESRVDMVPDAVTVITREQIDQMVAPTTIDILKDAAGVEVYNGRGPLSSSTFNRVIMRGQGSVAARILVLLNGVPQSGGQAGEFEWSFVNPRDIERIEIVRGPGSALYGSQAMGGVVNIITRKPSSEKGETTLETKYGTMNTMSLGASHTQKAGDWGFYGSGTVGGTQGYRVAPEVSKSGGQPTNSRKLRQRNEWGRGVVTYDIDPSSSLNLNIMHGHYLNRGTYDYMPDFLLFENQREQGDLSYVKRFEGGEFSAYGSASYQASSYDNAAASKTVSGRAPAKQMDYQGGMKTHYALGNYNTVSLGVDLKRTTYDRRNDNYATGTDAYGSSGGDSLTYGAFLQDELKLFGGRVVIVPGMRYEYTSLFDGYNELRAVGLARQDIAKKILRSLTSRIGARYTATDWISFRAAYGEAFRAPTLHELYGVSNIGTSRYHGNDALKPERLKSIEGGVDITPLDDLRLSVTVYKNHATDYIDNVLISAGPNVYNRRNIGTVDTAGIETELEYRFLDHWRSFVNYQRCDPKLMTGAYTGQRITGTPLSTTSAGLSFNDPKLFSVSVVNRWVGKIFNDANNTTAYGKYDVLNVKLAKAFELEASRLEVSLDVSNALDVTVQETSSSEAPGRLITLGMAWTF